MGNVIERVNQSDNANNSYEYYKNIMNGANKNDSQMNNENNKLAEAYKGPTDSNNNVDASFCDNTLSNGGSNFSAGEENIRLETEQNLFNDPVESRIVNTDKTNNTNCSADDIVDSSEQGEMKSSVRLENDFNGDDVQNGTVNNAASIQYNKIRSGLNSVNNRIFDDHSVKETISSENIEVKDAGLNG